jgi:hypothetical protein
MTIPRFQTVTGLTDKYRSHSSVSFAQFLFLISKCSESEQASSQNPVLLPSFLYPFSQVNALPFEPLHQSCNFVLFFKFFFFLSTIRYKKVAGHPWLRPVILATYRQRSAGSWLKATLGK